MRDHDRKEEPEKLYDVLFFDITGMSCAGCSSTIKDALQRRLYVEEIDVDIVTKRARVVVITKTDPKKVAQWIKEINPKFNATYIPANNEYTVCFSIKGLSSLADAKKIQLKLTEMGTLISDCSVNWATKAIRIVFPIQQNKKKITETKLMLKDTIQKMFEEEGRDLLVQEIEMPTDENANRHQTKEFLHKSFLNFLLGAALMYFSSSIPLPITLFGQLVGVVLGGVTLGVMCVTGGEFYKDAWREFWQNRKFNMNTLISLGTGSAWLYSMFLVLLPGFFPIVALQYQFLAVPMILGFTIFGRAVRAHAEEETRKNIKKISNVYVSMQPQWVKRVKKEYQGNFESPIPPEMIEEIPYQDIKVNDIIRVLKDEYVPVEGKILNDVDTSVNEEAMTGESKLCQKTKGDNLFSGTCNKEADLYVKASCDGDKARLVEIINDNAKSSQSKPTISKKIDTVARYFVPAIIFFALLSGFGWFLLGPVPVLPYVIKAIMATLLCACPCTLFLATPISIAIAMRKLLNEGVLVHDATSIEALEKVTDVVCDKTGTLTYAVYKQIYVARDARKHDETLNSETILRYAVRVEREVDHPIASAFKQISLTHDSEISYMPCEEVYKGEQGVSGVVNQKEIHIGTAQFLAAADIEVDESMIEIEKRYAAKGMSSVYVSINRKCVAVVALEHKIRPDAISDIHRLKKLGIPCHIATGDKQEIADQVAKELHIPPFRVKAGLSPKQKQDYIKELQKNGHCVAMVGDNINDSLAFQVADVSIALGPWTNASATSRLTLKKLNISTLIIISRKTMENIHQNLGWTLGYNLLSLFAASGLFYIFFAFALSPIVASALMACSSIIVVLNSSRLSQQIDTEKEILEDRMERRSGLWPLLNPLTILSNLIATMKVFFSVLVDNQQEAPPSPKPNRPPLNFNIDKGIINRFGQPVETVVPGSPQAGSPKTGSPKKASPPRPILHARNLLEAFERAGENLDQSPNGSLDAPPRLSALSPR